MSYAIFVKILSQTYRCLFFGIAVLAVLIFPYTGFAEVCGDSLCELGEACEADCGDNDEDYALSVEHAELMADGHEPVLSEHNTVFIRDIADCALSSITGLNHGSWDGVTRTCTLTGNVQDNISILVDNITLDCNFNLVQGVGSGAGISIGGRTGVGVKNCNVQGFRDGISLGNDSFTVLENNQVSNNSNYGIGINQSRSSILRNNQIFANKFNFRLDAFFSGTFEHDIDTSNLVDGKPIFYLRDVSNMVIDSSSNAGTVYCVRCSNMTVRDLTLQGNGMGISFAAVFDSLVENVHVLDNEDGLNLLQSHRNTVRNSTASNNERFGMGGNRANFNVYTGNEMDSNNEGIRLGLGGLNTISHNVVTNSRPTGTRFPTQGGIYLWNSSTTTVHDNTVINSRSTGIGSLNIRGGATIYNNNVSETSGGVAYAPYSCGISLYTRSSNPSVHSVSNNTLHDNNCGIAFVGPSSGSIISGNTVENGEFLGIALFGDISNTTVSSNRVRGSTVGLAFGPSGGNHLIYNNYFDNAANVGYPSATPPITPLPASEWSVPLQLGTNIIGGPYLGGNYWSDYFGGDTDGDTIGDVFIPFTANGLIVPGDFLPLTDITLVDTDGDGVFDIVDECPLEDATGMDINGDGCIDVDSDGDGLYDFEDECPLEDATGQDEDGDGCIDDSDGDGIIDSEDECPFEDASGLDADQDGCIDSIMDLIMLINSFNLQQGIENSLDAKLEAALRALDALNAGNRSDAVKKIEAFINEVKAQRGISLTNEQADLLIAMAENVIAQLV